MLTLLYAVALTLQQSPNEYNPKGPILVIAIENKGVFEITTDPKSSPKTVSHIVSLAKKGFYNRQRIHRVESWVVQWGAPASKDKPLDSIEVLSGGSGKQLPFEESKVDFTRGICGIASTGLQVGGDSQIFILKQDWLRLWRSYAVLGKVTKGMEVVDKLRRGDRILRITVRENQRKNPPLNDHH